MRHPARSKRAMVASCRLPLGIPSLSLLGMCPCAADPANDLFSYEF
jgi:hypothetical protein